jgi:3beta-hydroxy-delta5-steroid dehydrogenase/steroid delta-isomerase
MGEGEPRRLEVDVPATAGMNGETGRETADLGTCLVTGGAGFLGSHLAQELIRRGQRVRVFDRAPLGYSHERLEVMRGDVTLLEDLRKACEGVDTVFHAAAVLDFARFATPERRDRSFAVNVEGVRNLLQACRDAGVTRLVHTSSNNVTLDGPVVDGDEDTPYAANPSDLYTQTKIEGEKLALAASGEGGLLTCAIRPGGIYGPGDPLMLARLVEECASGIFLSTIGDGSAMSDNTYVDNLVDGQIEAALHLTAGSPLVGQAYFITDGAPINYFEFFRPIVEGMGFRYPTLKLPGRSFEWLLQGNEGGADRGAGGSPPHLHGLGLADLRAGLCFPGTAGEADCAGGQGQRLQPVAGAANRSRGRARPEDIYVLPLQPAGG